jgi:hypothetical protein
LGGKRQNPDVTMWGVKWLHYEQDCRKFPHLTFQSLRWEFYLQMCGVLPLIQNKTCPVFRFSSKSWQAAGSHVCQVTVIFLLKISHVQNGNRLCAIGNTSLCIDNGSSVVRFSARSPDILTQVFFPRFSSVSRKMPGQCPD